VKWALLFTLGGLGTVIVAACIAFLFLRHRLHRLHRVHHATPTEAPLTWLVDPRLPARLHRRLAKVGQAAEAVAEDHRPQGRRFRKPPAVPPIVHVAEGVRDQAVAVDRRLPRLAMLSAPARREPLDQISRSVDELERTTARLVEMSADLRTPRTLASDDPGLLDVAGQVERLAEAHRALDDLDHQAGLAPRARQ
jgi:hypothetical protein